MYCGCTTLVLRKHISNHETPGRIPEGLLYYGCTTLVQEQTHTHPLILSSSHPLIHTHTHPLILSSSLPLIHTHTHTHTHTQKLNKLNSTNYTFFVLRLYYACTTGSNFKSGAGLEDPRATKIPSRVPKWHIDRLQGWQPSGAR